jgi:hypothetical protein
MSQQVTQEEAAKFRKATHCLAIAVDQCVADDYQPMAFRMASAVEELRRENERLEESNQRLAQENRDFQMHEAQTHHELGAILGDDDSLLNGAKRLQRQVDQLKTDTLKSPSQICREQHVQNCQFCDRMDCGDNTSEAKKQIATLKGLLREARHNMDWMIAPMHTLARSLMDRIDAALAEPPAEGEDHP